VPGNLGNDVCAFLIPGNEKTGLGMQTLNKEYYLKIGNVENNGIKIT